MKFEKDGQVIEINDPNSYNIFLREGFVKVEEDEEEHTEERAELIAKAKELGIKSPHMMKTETLLEKISELEEK